MQATHEMTVGRTKLAEAIRFVTRHGAVANPIRFSGRDGGLAVGIDGGVTEVIEGRGTWRTPVAIDARLLRRLSVKFPRTREITLVYTSGRLFLGPTNIPAREIVEAPF